MQALSVKVMSISLISIIFLTVCAADDVDEVETYFNELAPVMDSATDAIEELNQINLDLARTEISQTNRSEVLRKIEVAATVTAQTHDKVTAAREGIHDTIAPRECAQIHDAVFEALQVSERGLAEMRLAYELQYSGLDSTRAMAEGNRLMAEADRLKSASLQVVGDCQ